MHKKKWLWYAPAILLVLLAGCSKREPLPTKPLTVSVGCADCHTDQALLKKLATPEKAPSGGEGEIRGGTVTPLEPWEKVFVKQDFFGSVHGKIACIGCHKGNPEAATPEAAHKGMSADPSEEPQTTCAGCHTNVVAHFEKSIHFNQNGYFTLFEKRAGFSLKDNPSLMAHFKQDCGTCHTTCGQCHVSRPAIVKGGFLTGHRFQKSPDMINNCLACHGSRTGEEYLGSAEGYRPDVHWDPGGKQCEFCHKESELHGSGAESDLLYNVPNAPRCENCHRDKAAANVYHFMHWKNLQCQVCHSQDYKNCNSCHVGAGGLAEPAYRAFKIGRNPIQSPGHPKAYVVLRHVPILRNSYAAWGVADLPNYNSEPTWKYSTPHNIRLWTDRTDTTGSGGNCAFKCHSSDTFFLRKADVAPGELDANQNVIVPADFPPKP
ncbi:hypothetical protein BMS3Abin05_02511 [bacterium BMS3Abin05]|nr:hypothetical protein BMS3Abin05_02511 [bacterium BMS3Abin05]